MGKLVLRWTLDLARYFVLVAALGYFAAKYLRLHPNLHQIAFVLTLLPLLAAPPWFAWNVCRIRQTTGYRRYLVYALFCALGWPLLATIDFALFLLPVLTHG